MYPADKGLDKCVLEHVAKHFKQYKRGLKRDYFKPKEKTREAMYEMNEATSKVQERLLSSSPSKTQVEIESEVFDELMYEEAVHSGKITDEFLDATEAALHMAGDQPKVKGRFPPCQRVNYQVLTLMRERKSRGNYHLRALRATSLGLPVVVARADLFVAITTWWDAQAFCTVPEESSGNDLGNESRHTGPSTSTSHIN
ncbi:hypothetical protein Cgig2_024063 [Carnegiea gigantea]|uniref:Uncharacterized protein n=1 Tax=Carnegiea gigantea TaxID=171969 RepID=A0A9Q1JJT4_9CARY|nr:hypothetical protein Cgig2_024063 [Carnegiea gigantea]